MIKPIQVIAIDDHPLQLQLLKQMLDRNEVEVHLYENVDDALSHDNIEHVDFIFCDLHMPDKNGVDMMVKLHERNYQNAVILMSSVEQSIISAASTMCENFSFNVAGHLNKPFTEEDVFNVIENIENRPETTPYVSSYIKSVGDQEFLFALGEGRIKNYYQPILDASTNKVVGYEALARWSHPIHGLLTPYYFLPIVERCDLTSELFGAVLGNVIKDIRHLGINKKVSLNVEQAELENENFSERLIERCKVNNVDPEQIIIEISERSTNSCTPMLFKNLVNLRLSGVTVSIDDFGKGFSSLDKLARLPFDELKIDRSLIKGIDKDLKKSAIVESVCGLAKNLGIRIVAEGIESIKLLNAIGQYEIDLYQGYHFSKPIPVEAISILE